MISATVAAWALPAVERSLISPPSLPRLSDALTVAKRVLCALASSSRRRA